MGHFRFESFRILVFIDPSFRYSRRLRATGKNERHSKTINTYITEGKEPIFSPIVLVVGRAIGRIKKKKKINKTRKEKKEYSDSMSA